MAATFTGDTGELMGGTGTRSAVGFEAAVPAGEDPVRYAELLGRIRDAALSGTRPPAHPRPVIDRSWARVRRAGVDPDGGDLRPSRSAEEVEHRRGGALGRVLPTLAEVLMPAAEDAGHVMVVVDRDGVILWRDGPQSIQRRAESLGFAAGADWSEPAVGTNAIGTALAVEHPIQVYSAEHFVAAHALWTCAAAPIHDPASGELLGVVDVSGAAATVHPSSLALVEAAARVAEHRLRDEHQGRLHQLRTLAAPLLARTGGRALVTDRDGWVSAAVGLSVAPRIVLPRVAGDRAHVPAIGTCRFEPLPGGWLIRVVEADDRPAGTRLALDLTANGPLVSVVSESGRYEHRLRPRHAELLCVLATRPSGVTGGELSEALFGEPGHDVAVRAEINRVRALLGPVIIGRPYRFAEWLTVEVSWPMVRAELLPTSLAPGVAALRTA